MKVKELLLECKVKKKLQSDYELAAELKIPRQRISEYMSGKRAPDAYAAFKIATTLGRDPAEVLAEIEAETEKNETRREFWRDFLQRVQARGRLYTLGLVFMVSLLGGLGLSAEKPGGFKRRLYFA